MELKEKLKTALKTAGLSEGLANLIKVDSEDQIEGVIRLLKPTQTPNQNELDFEKIIESKAFTKYVEEVGFDKILEQSKTLQSAHDKKVTGGIKSFKDKYFKDIDPKKDEEKQTTDNHSKDIPDWAKGLLQKVENLEKNNRAKSNISEAEEIIKKSKLPKTLQKKWIGRIAFEGKKSLDDQVKILEEEYDELRQSLVSESLGKGLPVGREVNGKATPSEVKGLVEELI